MTYDLQIELDRAERAYEPGEKMHGVVRVKVHAEYHCEGLYVDRLFLVSGRGDRRERERYGELLFQGNWKSKSEHSYPFTLEVPTAPMSYEGRELRVEWVVRARVESETEGEQLSDDIVFTVMGEESEIYFDGPPSAGIVPFTALETINEWVVPLLLAAGFFAMILTMMSGTLGVLFMVILLGLLVFQLRNPIAEELLGPIEVSFSSREISPGGSVKVGVSFHSRRTFAQLGVDVILRGEERVVAGNGFRRGLRINRTCEMLVQVATQQTVTTSRRTTFSGDVVIPEDAIPTFKSGQNEITWYIELHIDLFPPVRWTKRFPLIVRPERVAALPGKQARQLEHATLDKSAEKRAAEDDGDDAAPVIIPKETALVVHHADNNSSRALAKVHDEPRREETDDGKAAHVDLEVADKRHVDRVAAERHVDRKGSDKRLEADSDVEVIEGEIVDEEAFSLDHSARYGFGFSMPHKDEVPAGEISMEAVLKRLSDSGPFTSDHERIISEVAERVFTVKIIVERIEQTIGFNMTADYRNGRTVVGQIEDGKTKVALAFSTERNAEIDAVKVGSSMTEQVTIRGWNSVFLQADMRVEKT